MSSVVPLVVIFEDDETFSERLVKRTSIISNEVNLRVINFDSMESFMTSVAAGETLVSDIACVVLDHQYTLSNSHYNGFHIYNALSRRDDFKGRILGMSSDSQPYLDGNRTEFMGKTHFDSNRYKEWVTEGVSEFIENSEPRIDSGELN